VHCSNGFALTAKDVEVGIAFYTQLRFEETYRYPTTGTPEHDAMGDLLVAPLLLIWATRPPKLDRTRTLEALTVLALLAGVSSAIFLGGLWRYPYPIFPLLVWATLRFRQLGAATGSFVVAAIAVAGVVAGETPLGGDLTTKVQVLQALLAFLAVSLLVLGATLSEREQANESLAEAQQLAHLGSWEWEIESDRVAWSSELFRIFGVDPQAGALTFESFLDRVHPDDRARVRAEVGRALAARRPFEVNHRIVLDNGTERAVHGRGRVVVDAAGAPNRMVGTAQDVTEQRRLEEVRDNILSAVSHELRTPLTSILGFALTLRERSELDAVARQQITDELAAQAEKLERLLLALLDIDRLRHRSSRTSIRPRWSESSRTSWQTRSSTHRPARRSRPRSRRRTKACWSASTTPDLGSPTNRRKRSSNRSHAGTTPPTRQEQASDSRSSPSSPRSTAARHGCKTTPTAAHPSACSCHCELRRSPEPQRRTSLSRDTRLASRRSIRLRPVRTPRLSEAVHPVYRGAGFVRCLY
jgi:PAS domain S-box-containing protein